MVFSSILYDIDPFIMGLIEEKKSIGFNLGIFSNGTSTVKSYGTLAIDEENECDPDTLFAIGSISKSFTCLAILILEENGKLSIHDPLSKYLPLNLNGREHKILIRHLMSHSSGLPDLFFCPIIEAATKIRDDYNSLNISIQLNSWEDIFEHIMKNQEFITSEPGERFHYSDISFSLLQYIITTISGISYSKFVSQEIFTPLEIELVTMRSQYSGQKAAFGHLSQEQSSFQFTKTQPNYPGHALADGGGGVMASSTSMINYLEFMANGGIFKNKRLISEERFNQLITPHIAITPKIGFYYGFGWMIFQNTKFGNIIFHTGHTGSITSGLGFIPEKRIGIYHSNNYSISPIPIFIKILTSVVGEPLQLMQDPPYYTRISSFEGNYLGPLGIEKLQVLFDQDKVKLIMRSVGIYAVEEEEFTLYCENDQYFIVKNGVKTRVVLEEHEGRKFVTIGFSKLKQV